MSDPVVLGVPIAWEVAEMLDVLFDAILAGDVEVATRHVEITTAA